MALDTWKRTFLNDTSQPAVGRRVTIEGIFPQTANTKNALRGAQTLKLDAVFTATDKQEAKREGEQVNDSVSEKAHKYKHGERLRGGDLLHVLGATKHTAGQIKSHKNQALRMEKQHTVFASYTAAAKPSIEGEQWSKSTFVATSRQQIVSALTEFPGSKSQIGLERVKKKTGCTLSIHSVTPGDRCSPVALRLAEA